MPATRLPSFQFYPGDWLKDPKLRSVSIAARGLWMDLICLMSESDPRGYLQDAIGQALSEKQIARMTGCAQQTVKKLLQELEVSGVFSRTETDGIIYSRRIVRDEEIRMKNRENGSKGGNPQLMKPVNPSVNRDANRNQTPSSSSSSSSSIEENTKKDSCSESKSDRFEKPTLAQVELYSREIRRPIDAGAFIDHYESNGWRIGGKSPMKDWQAAVRNWARRDDKQIQHSNGRSISGGSKVPQIDQMRRNAVTGDLLT